jgi:hypothetical protein
MNNSRMFEHLLREIDKIKKRLDYATRAEVPRPFVGCRLSRTSDQAVANITYVAIEFTGETYDLDTMHSTVTNTAKIYARHPGYYHIVGQMKYQDSSGGGDRWGTIWYNTSTLIAKVQLDAPSSGINHYVEVSTVYYLNVDDYVELVAYQSSGGSLNVQEARVQVSRLG